MIIRHACTYAFIYKLFWRILSGERSAPSRPEAQSRAAVVCAVQDEKVGSPPTLQASDLTTGQTQMQPRATLRQLHETKRQSIMFLRAPQLTQKSLRRRRTARDTRRHAKSY